MAVKINTPLVFMMKHLKRKIIKNNCDIYGCQEIYHIKVMAANISRSGTGSLIGNIYRRKKMV